MSSHQQKRGDQRGPVRTLSESDSGRTGDPYLLRGHFSTRLTLLIIVRTWTRFDSSVLSQQNSDPSVDTWCRSSVFARQKWRGSWKRRERTKMEKANGICNTQCSYRPVRAPRILGWKRFVTCITNRELKYIAWSNLSRFGLWTVSCLTLVRFNGGPVLPSFENGPC
jgi:hypothetical protein